MDPIQALRNDFLTTIEALRNEIQYLKQQLDKKSRPKPSLPDPEKFSGQALKFDTWLPSIKAKLHVDGEAIGDTVSQFYYVYLNLDSHVQATVLPQLAQAEESGSWDYNTILNQLSRVYANPNKIQEAEDRLLAVKQDPSESLAAYIAKFERILYEARGQDWPDVTKISTFRKGLNSMICNRLSQQLNLPRTYPEFLRVVQQLAGHSFNSMPPGNGSGPPRVLSGSHTRNPDTMDINTVTFNNIDPSPGPILSYRDEGRCFRCGSSDHWVKDCPQPKESTTRSLWNPRMLAALEARNSDSE
jgi:hypothetical protein